MNGSHVTEQAQVWISDRETTITKLVDALGVLKTGRQQGQETIGLLAPMRRAAAEGLADLGFRWVEASAKEKVVAAPESWLGPHAVGQTAPIDPAAAADALGEFNPELAAAIRAADTEEKRAALREQLRPKVDRTLDTAVGAQEAVDVLRTQARAEAAAAREQGEAAERGQ